MTNFFKVTSPKSSEVANSNSFYIGENNSQLVAMFELDITEIKQKLQKINYTKNLSLRALILKSVIESINDLEKFNTNSNKYFKIFVEDPFYNQAKTFSFSVNADNFDSKDISKNIANYKYNQELSCLNKLFSKKRNPNILSYLPRIIKILYLKHFIKKPYKSALKKGNSILFNIGYHLKKIENKNSELLENTSIGLCSTLRKIRLINNKIQSREIIPITITTSNTTYKKDEFVRQMRTNITNNLTFAELL